MVTEGDPAFGYPIGHYATYSASEPVSTDATVISFPMRIRSIILQAAEWKDSAFIIRHRKMNGSAVFEFFER